ncbi:MAG: hypothetical protein INH41_02170 [Myxococcaceae bacterium]|nr:hypothetical protein [Myxococcaceae bacterium]MCA3011185.1 hypothetical protein [Myxococcaceae bacterium]
MRLTLTAVACLVVACEPEPETGGFSGSGAGGRGATSRQPAPLFGGTVAVALDGRMVAVSDPDGDALWLIDVSTGSKVRVALPPGSQPGRAVDDGAGRFVVALRRAGQVARVVMKTGALDEPLTVCAEPRGLTRAESGVLLACATGEVMKLEGDAVTTVRVTEHELRDVVTVGDQLYASSFREAELVSVLDQGGRTIRPPSMPAFPSSATPVSFVPHVAWRTLQVPTAEGMDVVMVHQHHRRGEPTKRPPTPSAKPVPVSSGYGSGSGAGAPPGDAPVETGTTQGGSPCARSVVRTVVTRFTATGVTSFEVPGVLPVDAALSPDGWTLAIAHASSHAVTFVNLGGRHGAVDLDCGPVNEPSPPLTRDLPLEHPIGVAYLPNGDLLTHFRKPHVLVRQEPGGREVARISLDATRIETPGHRLFHHSTGSIACASCHPEGHDDAHTWTVQGVVRRTQALSGGLTDTAPFHWAGDLPSLKDVMQDTFVSRMGGAAPSDVAIDSLGRFLDAIEAPRPLARASTGPAASGYGAFLKAGCDGCHRGARLRSQESWNIGKGAAMQVPSLVGVSRRGPWMSDGCAATLRERFTNVPCGGRGHGDVSSLSPGEVDALVAYLERL